ncbi:MAG TPA: TIGR03013 family XrtA/PEP-CTERM system glycosyltransferase [Verrucomicrobiae bacterium]|nr:TIGR03013 family XrtA/PEP-CTERM system glycosyltransferase [Verrucomicrobiae bacterium]
MIRLLHAYFPTRTLFLGVSEACLISLAFLAATVARLGADGAGFVFNYQHGSLKILVVSVAIVICMYYFDLYETSVLANHREVIVRIVETLGTVYCLSVLLYYLYPPLELGRGIFVIGLVFTAMLLLLWRMLFSKINSVPELSDRALIFGEGPLAELLESEFESRTELGIRVVGRFLPSNNGNGNHHRRSKPAEFEVDPTSTQVSDDLSRTVKQLRATRVVVAMGDRRGKLPVDVLLSLKCRGLQVQDGVEVYEAITGKVPIESIRLGWLLFSPGCHSSRFHLAYKRAASIVVSIIGLLLTLPLLPFIFLAIKLTSAGPVLYRQKRVGRDGIVFNCFKFRTMRADAEADTGATWALDDDPRITRIGKFLRLSRMDEIPQLWNVLRGDMSLVGPRPERPEFVDTLRKEIPYYHLRHTVRPGITGWAQVRYKYGSSVENSREKLRYDLFYIKNMSAGLDLLVFLHTIKIILLGRGAR